MTKFERTSLFLFQHAQEKQTKKKHHMSTNGIMQKDTHKKMKRKRDLNNGKTVTKEPDQETETPQTTPTSSTIRDKKKKKRKLTSDTESTDGGPVTPEHPQSARAAGGTSSGQPTRLSVPGGFSWETSSWPQTSLQAVRPTAGDDSSDDDDVTQQQVGEGEGVVQWRVTDAMVGGEGGSRCVCSWFD